MCSQCIHESMGCREGEISHGANAHLSSSAVYWGYYIADSLHTVCCRLMLLSIGKRRGGRENEERKIEKEERERREGRVEGKERIGGRG